MGYDDMEYLKFNCHDLAAQNTELYSVYSKIQQLSSELDNVVSSFDMQIKSYEDLQKQFTSSQTVMADIVARFLALYNALDQIIDLYYAAENKALQAAENLSVKISLKGSTKANAIPMASISSINNKDLILEDWLAELIYKYGKDEIRGENLIK